MDGEEMFSKFVNTLSDSQKADVFQRLVDMDKYEQTHKSLKNFYRTLTESNNKSKWEAKEIDHEYINKYDDDEYDFGVIDSDAAWAKGMEEMSVHNENSWI